MEGCEGWESVSPEYPEELEVMDSGANHERVGEKNPSWGVFDWCWYWEKDVRKAFKKAGVEDPGGRVMDCGDGCVCKTCLLKS